MKTDREAGLHPAAGYDHFNFQRPARRGGSLLAPFASITWIRFNGSPALPRQTLSLHPVILPGDRAQGGCPDRLAPLMDRR